MSAALFSILGVPLGSLYLRENFGRRLHALEEMERYDAERVAEEQLERFREIVGFARTHVPLYRELYKDIAPEDIRIPSDVTKVPPVTKEMLRAGYPNRVVAEGIRRKDMIPNSTSGSTGVPLAFFMSRALLASKGSRYLRGNRWAGARPGELIYQIWGKQEGAPWRRAFIRWVAGRINRSAFEMDADTMAAFLKEIRAVKPRLVETYTSAGHALARFLRDSGSPLTTVGAAVTTSGETLTDTTRQLVSEWIGPVFNRYGSREFGAVAHECPAHQGMHVHAESFLVEVVNGAGNSVEGESGRVLITCFENRVQPFIRYEIGDVGVMASPGKCDCGMALPRLGAIQGRIADLLYNPEGQLISIHYLTLLFEEYSASIERFQALQTAPGTLEILVIPTSRLTSSIEEELTRKVQHHVGKNMRVKLRRVTGIPSGPDGKRRLMKRLF